MSACVCAGVFELVRWGELWLTFATFLLTNWAFGFIFVWVDAAVYFCCTGGSNHTGSLLCGMWYGSYLCGQVTKVIFGIVVSVFLFRLFE